MSRRGLRVRARIGWLGRQVLRAASAALRSPRLARDWAKVGAGPAMTAVFVWLVQLVVYGPWPKSLAAAQLAVLHHGLLGVVLLLLVYAIALSGVALKASRSVGGASLELGRDHEAAE